MRHAPPVTTPQNAKARNRGAKRQQAAQATPKARGGTPLNLVTALQADRHLHSQCSKPV